nr:MAG TPA: hypothetical protein [Caudoviricetes sp.]
MLYNHKSFKARLRPIAKAFSIKRLMATLLVYT